MPLIKDKKIVDDTWTTLSPEATTSDIANGDTIIPLSLWNEAKGKLQNRNGKLGVALTADEDIEDILNDLDQLDLVALEFPMFKNGRHYSSARLLRDRYNFKGEIRAYGDVNRDQLYYMTRVGFNAFQLNDGADIEQALNGFNDFSVQYQSSYDQPLPLYRRR